MRRLLPLMVFSLVLLVIMAGASAVKSADCLNGMYEGWTLNNTGHTGTTTMGACNRLNLTEFNTPTTGVTGAFAEGYNFTKASSEYLWNATNTPTRTGNNVTIAFWIKPKTETSADYAWIYGADFGTTPNYIAMFYVSASAKWEIMWRNGAAYWSWTTDSDTIGIGNLTYVVVQWAGTNMTVFLNATQHAMVAGAATTGGSPDSSGLTASTYVVIGAEDTTGAVPASYSDLALVDEFAIYNRSLTAAEAYNLFYYNDLSGVSISDITPNYAVINESTTFSATTSDNVSAATNWYWNFSYGGIQYFTATTESTSQTLNYTGTWNVTAVATFAGTNYSRSENITVAPRPIANFTISSATPYMAGSSIQFNDTSTYTGSSWGSSAWTFNDTNTSALQNATNTFLYSGYYYVCLNVSNNYSIWASALYCSNVTINGLALDVFNEKTLAAITNWTVTFANSTYTKTYTPNNNTFTWNNYTNFPIGALTISVSATGYIGRTYYRTYNLNTPLNFDTYLLDTASGVYSYFIVQNTLGANLEDVWLVVTYTSGGTTYTIAEAKTDSSGSATMWLDWTKPQIVTAEKTGYTTVSKSITPQPTTYLIIMGSSSVFNYTYLNSSLWTFISPTNPIVNLTTDTITAGVLDPSSTITICGLNLTYLNGTVFHSHTNALEQHYCTNSIPLVGSGAPNTPFLAFLWYTYGGGSGNSTRTYTPASTNTGSVGSAQSGMLGYLGGPEARLMLAITVTLFVGAAAAAYVGSGAVLIMIVVSGLFAIWGWFGTAVGLYVIAVMAGLAALYLEQRV